MCVDVCEPHALAREVTFCSNYFPFFVLSKKRCTAGMLAFLAVLSIHFSEERDIVVMYFLNEFPEIF